MFKYVLLIMSVYSCSPLEKNKVVLCDIYSDNNNEQRDYLKTISVDSKRDKLIKLYERNEHHYFVKVSKVERDIHIYVSKNSLASGDKLNANLTSRGKNVDLFHHENSVTIMCY